MIKDKYLVDILDNLTQITSLSEFKFNISMNQLEWKFLKSLYQFLSIQSNL